MCWYIKQYVILYDLHSLVVVLDSEHPLANCVDGVVKKQSVEE